MSAAELPIAIAGVRVGQATDLALGSGVTVIAFDQPAVASGLVLGGAPGGRDTALLAPEMTVERVDALVLSGGSAFGLDAAGGVQAGLREDSRGFAVGSARVPIVPQAILMDLLNGGDKDWGRFSPYGDLGYRAYRAAGDHIALGTVGAGTGATTATLKGGLGAASMTTPAGHRLLAIVAVNAMGSATIADGPQFWAAPFEVGAEFGGLGWPAPLPANATRLRLKGVTTPATTIGALITDAALTKAQAHRLAILGHDGLTRAILPAHLPFDGDTVFAAATGAQALADQLAFAELAHGAALVTARAVALGVYHATSLPVAAALPAWRDRFGPVEPRRF